MKNSYLKEKSAQTAHTLTQSFDINYATALRMTTRLWDEARAMILRHVTPDEWKKLSQQDKAAICAELIRALMDKKKLLAFLSGERRSLC